MQILICSCSGGCEGALSNDNMNLLGGTSNCLGLELEVEENLYLVGENSCKICVCYE